MSANPEIETLFYDGRCGLCHRTVRFVLWADGARERFRFAPLDGVTFRETVSETDRTLLPDSLVLRTADGALLARSAAVLRILRRLGGFWSGVALLARLVPPRWRDALYDFVARRRLQWFARPADACPVVPENLRLRFLP